MDKKILDYFRKYNKLMIVTEIEVIFNFLRNQSRHNVYICIDNIPKMEIKPKMLVLSTFEFNLTPDFKIMHIPYSSRPIMETVHDIHDDKKRVVSKILEEIRTENTIVFDDKTEIYSNKDITIFSSTEEAMWYLLDNFNKVPYLNVIDTGYIELDIYINSGETRKRKFSFFSNNSPPKKNIERRKRLFSVIDSVNYHTFPSSDKSNDRQEINYFPSLSYNRSPSRLLLSSKILKNKFIPFFVFVHEFEGISGGFLRVPFMTLRKLIDLCNLFIYHVTETDEEINRKTGINIDKIRDVKESLSEFGYINKPQEVSMNEVIEEIKNRAIFYFDIFRRYNNRQYYNLNNISCRDLLTCITSAESDTIVLLSKFKDKIVLFAEI
jgi:hypothetical protein